MKNSKWFLVHGDRPAPAYRVFCFPYAGASASLAVFREWASFLPADVQLIAVELPGRGRRYGTPLVRSLHSLVEQILTAIRPLTGLPYTFVGHSIGALLAFELARAMRDKGLRLPETLLVSGKRAPQLPHKQRLHLLPDNELILALKDYNGTPDAVLEHPELMELFLPILRADFSLAETYRHIPAAPLPIPIHAYGGVDDPGVKQECLEPWRSHTSTDFNLEMLPGDHFFIEKEARQAMRERLVARIVETRNKNAQMPPVFA
ncbi:thioesterase II family protein [Microbulbifer halophilus]|uniref:Thioesterase II family protein n=1 Tax=Microbulbifer halophilus TaxID=453963 RepID=A0ABW5EDG5_9GAMM|nr:alpha/beta fold hydrolase [Microbulbifer halophilus]MCW8128218.1 alpha/beta fold hydrolase [Microbulbifer halophilus]